MIANNKKAIKNIVILETILITVVVVASLVVSNQFFKNIFFSEAMSQLNNTVESYSYAIKYSSFKPSKVCPGLASKSNLRISLIDSSGIVVCDTNADITKLDRHETRPEFLESLEKNYGNSIRHSDSLKLFTLYSAKTIVIGGEKYVLRLAVNLGNYQKKLLEVWFYFIICLIPIVFVSSVLIINHFYRSEQKYRQANRKLRGDFIANISHEIKTPLTSISGYVQLLKSQSAAMNDISKDCIHRISHNSDRLSFLFDDVLKLSDLENEAPLDIEQISSKSLVVDIIDDFRDKAAESNIHVSHALADINFEGDQKYSYMIISNLISNAIKYSRPDGEVFISTKTDGSNITFSIRDKGYGISDMGRVFERFYREKSKDVSHISGTGLGLAIVKHAVNRHNGKVWCVSVRNQGSSFFVELPLKHIS